MTAPSHPHLVTRLYEGVNDEAAWHEALEGFAAWLQCGTVSIVQMHRDTRLISVKETYGPDAISVEAQLREHIADADAIGAATRCGALCQMRNGTEPVTYPQYGNIEPQIHSTSDGLRLHWYPLFSSLRTTHVLVLAEARNEFGMTCVSRELEDFLYALSRAVSLRAHLRSLTRSSCLGQRIVDRFNVPVVVVNDALRPMYANSSGRTWLHEQIGGHMELIKSSCKHERGGHLIRFIKDLCCGGDGAPGSILISGRGEQAGSLVIGVPFLAQTTDDRSEPLVLLVAHQRSTQHPSWIPLVASAFSLSAAEQRLLEQMIQVDTLDHAADNLGISKETTKTHLKSIFAKTGTKRQTGLIRMVSNISQIF